MATANDKRTHWYLGRNAFGQKLRLCNGYRVGIFVTNNKPENKVEVTCTTCKKTLNEPKLFARQMKYQADHIASDAHQISAEVAMEFVDN